MNISYTQQLFLLENFCVFLIHMEAIFGFLFSKLSYIPPSQDSRYTGSPEFTASNQQMSPVMSHNNDVYHDTSELGVAPTVQDLHFTDPDYQRLLEDAGENQGLENFTRYLLQTP